jgi:hypothetical protein
LDLLIVHIKHDLLKALDMVLFVVEASRVVEIVVKVHCREGVGESDEVKKFIGQWARA